MLECTFCKTVWIDFVLSCILNMEMRWLSHVSVATLQMVVYILFYGYLDADK
jgi:hypothetical protein